MSENWDELFGTTAKVANPEPEQEDNYQEVEGFMHSVGADMDDVVLVEQYSPDNLINMVQDMVQDQSDSMETNVSLALSLRVFLGESMTKQQIIDGLELLKEKLNGMGVKEPFISGIALDTD